MRFALSSSTWHLSHMHEVASSTGASHAGYVQKKHPWEISPEQPYFGNFFLKEPQTGEIALNWGF